MEIHCNGLTARVAPGGSLFDYAESLGMFVPTSCQKLGKCKECLVEVTEGLDLLTPRTKEEQHLDENFRLSCQAGLAAAEGVVRYHTMRRGDLRIERHGFSLPGRSGAFAVDPCVTRDGDRVLMDGREIDRTTGPLHGVAVDLGTTTVVLRLFDLESGEVVADSSFENPQRFGGSDVMSRIHFDTTHKGHLLQRTIAGYLGHAIDELPVDPRSIYEIVIAGNSTMRDIFFRLDVWSIGQNPYRSITEIELRDGKRAATSLATIAPRLLLPRVNRQARVYGLPIISGHVGADAAACMLAIDLAHEDRLVCIMDIGTNTELILGNRHRILAASCPAGPAFEGGKIRFGMPGLPGAIEHLRIGDDGAVRASVIGDGPAEGICGSGLVDALGELLRTGRMNSLGRLEDGDEFVLAPRTPHPVSLHERDINELAQAKGANVAGLHIIFDQYGCRFEDVDTFYLAGGFGRHLDVASARRIGLIPDLPDAKVIQVGNAAIEGASIALLSRARREELEQLVRQVTHCRLESHPEFFHYFVEGCQFHPVESLGVGGS